MKDKGIIKFKGNESKGAMHYITFRDKLVSLTQKDSRKVKHINSFGSIEIAPNLLSRNFEEKKIIVVDDTEYTNEVFNYMLEQKHTHYKKSPEGLVVLQYA